MGETADFELAFESITRSIIGAFYEVYNILGYGFLESVYVAALVDELTARGHKVVREVGVRVTYKDKAIAWHRIDLLVDGCVVVECKAGEVMAPHAPPTASELPERNRAGGRLASAFRSQANDHASLLAHSNQKIGSNRPLS